MLAELLDYLDALNTMSAWLLATLQGVVINLLLIGRSLFDCKR